MGEKDLRAGVELCPAVLSAASGSAVGLLSADAKPARLRMVLGKIILVLLTQHKIFTSLNSHLNKIHAVSRTHLSPPFISKGPGLLLVGKQAEGIPKMAAEQRDLPRGTLLVFGLCLFS